MASQNSKCAFTGGQCPSNSMMGSGAARRGTTAEGQQFFATNAVQQPNRLPDANPDPWGSNPWVNGTYWVDNAVAPSDLVDITQATTCVDCSKVDEATFKKECTGDANIEYGRWMFAPCAVKPGRHFNQDSGNRQIKIENDRLGVASNLTDGSNTAVDSSNAAPPASAHTGAFLPGAAPVNYADNLPGSNAPMYARHHQAPQRLGGLTAAPSLHKARDPLASHIQPANSQAKGGASLF